MTDSKGSVLVVDDAPDARLVMQAALRKDGYEVHLAASGDEALQKFQDMPTDLVMLDVDMPGMNGYEVCAALRAKAGPLLPIVMVTGLDDVESVQAAYDCGATDFIAKPINWALIGHRLHYLFRSHRTTLSLSAAEARQAAILNALPDDLLELDLDGNLLDAWAPHSELLAQARDAWLGRNIADVVPNAAAEVCLEALREAHQTGASTGRQAEWVVESSSHWFELSVSRKVVAPGTAPRFMLVARDITERKDAERRIAHLAFFDGLTGLPNRLSFMERVDLQIRENAEHQRPLAVLFMDLDGFKNVNDTLGHSVGDLVLQAAAERLRATLRPTDMLARASSEPNVQLARLGGDEFTALVLSITRPEDAIAVAERMGQAMRQPFDIEGRVVTLDSSVGIAIYPQDGEDAETLLKHADTAMYQAKDAGRGRAQLYSVDLTERLRRRMALDASLRVALERDEFHLVYQPQVELASGRATAFEALLRWQHPERGLISPLEFIPLAEETGLIEPIGEWVLRRACDDAAGWMRSGAPVAVAVNLSVKQFRSAKLPQQVLGTLAATGLPGNLLEVEITESLLMHNPAAARSVLELLGAHGVRTALDDFGTGYSSLAYLTRMPIGRIKIDRMFVADLLHGGESAAIVRAILAMADSLHMVVTAEGVETLEQARALMAMGCGYLQGYYLGRPAPAKDVLALAAKHWHAELYDAPTAVNPGPDRTARTPHPLG